jgi:hypothetical protein
MHGPMNVKPWNKLILNLWPALEGFRDWEEIRSLLQVGDDVTVGSCDEDRVAGTLAADTGNYRYARSMH